MARAIQFIISIIEKMITMYGKYINKNLNAFK